MKKENITKKINEGDLIKIFPYEERSIFLIGIVKNIGVGTFSKKQFIKIKGIKVNSYEDILYFSYKIWEFDFDKIEVIKTKKELEK